VTFVVLARCAPPHPAIKAAHRAAVAARVFIGPRRTKPR
jgi:hypothetical protein